jgi:hypothetical protein
MVVLFAIVAADRIYIVNFVFAWRAVIWHEGKPGGVGMGIELGVVCVNVVFMGISKLTSTQPISNT